jgi:hypothetical protein
VFRLTGKGRALYTGSRPNLHRLDAIPEKAARLPAQ